ncbi:MAG: hypothetical protein PHQ03_00510, partial [Methylococcales bacterium]|nr:hypothetical protein [Methylococcales bacterium]
MPTNTSSVFLEKSMVVASLAFLLIKIEALLTLASKLSIGGSANSPLPTVACAAIQEREPFCSL